MLAYREDHEAFRGIADEVEGVTGDEGKALLLGLGEYIEGTRGHDGESVDAVGEVSVASDEADEVATLDAAEGAEEAIAMGGEDSVAGLAWEWSAGHVSDGAAEGGSVNAVADDDVDLEAGDFEASDDKRVALPGVPGAGWFGGNGKDGGQCRV